MAYSYTDILGGKGNQNIVRFARGTQEQFNKMDTIGFIKPDIYMKDNTIYLVIPTNDKPLKVVFDTDNDRPDSIEENPFLQESIDI